MGAFTFVQFVGLAPTSSTKVIFGELIPNLIQLQGQKIGGFTIMILAIFGISLATITVNITVNVVAAANALVDLNRYAKKNLAPPPFTNTDRGHPKNPVPRQPSPTGCQQRYTTNWK
ncbi:hypothetical protein SLA2020_070690 [Shorea laevis]